jgi:hypothetical protein
VDPVAVERQRRVAEQQHVVGHDLALPGRAGLRALGWRLDVAGPLGVAVHDVVELDDGRFRGAVAAHFVAHLDEDEPAGAAFLGRHVGDDRRALDGVADPHR